MTPYLVDFPTCEHGGDARLMASGLPRCPQCRHALPTFVAPPQPRRRRYRTQRLDVTALTANDLDLLEDA